MNLICNRYEDPNYQCTAVDDGQRCLHGVKNKKRMLCSKHLARFFRHGTTEMGPPKGETRAQREARRRKSVEERKRKNGWSDICFCTHILDSHSPITNSCQEKDCNCREFDCSNKARIAEFFAKAATLGFNRVLNDTAFCQSCNKFVTVGAWHNPETIGRMRIHLRMHPPGRRIRRAG